MDSNFELADTSLNASIGTFVKLADRNTPNGNETITVQDISTFRFLMLVMGNPNGFIIDPIFVPVSIFKEEKAIQNRQYWDNTFGVLIYSFEYVTDTSIKVTVNISSWKYRIYGIY